MNPQENAPDTNQVVIESQMPSVGSIAPNFVLDPGSNISQTLHDLRGTPIIMVFSSTDWNPAHAERMAQLYNALVAATPTPSDAVTGIARKEDGYALGFADAEVTIPVLHDLNQNGAAAERFGVRGKKAVFALDAQGVVQWRYVASEGTSPRIGDIVAGLQAVPSLPAPDKDAAAGAWQATRRDFIATALAGVIALAVLPATSAEAQNAPAKPIVPGGATLPVQLNINGKNHKLNLDSRVTLLDALREHIGLTGSKKGCDHGQCGACTVHIDGESNLSCLALAVQQEGAKIVTIEGLAKGDDLHPVQQAFLDYDGYQCGYCTPGQIMSAVTLIREGHAKSDAEIREGMSGNLCRCAAYPHILAAVKAARDSGKRV